MIKLAKKIKNEEEKLQLDDKNVMYPSGKIAKVVIELYHEEIQNFVLFIFSGPC